MASYLVTGANRGIGLEFTRRLAVRGETVVATARNLPALAPDAAALPGVRWVPLDVADQESVRGLADRVAASGVRSIDVLINNSGVSSTAKTLEQLTADELHRVFAINAFAPLLVARAVLPMLASGGRKLIVNISSQLASIANNTGGSTYPYRASKAALNQLTVCLANELRAQGAGYTCLAMHPGWVRTDMGGRDAPLSTEQAVGHMLGVLDSATPEMSGRFLNFDGKPLPW